MIVEVWVQGSSGPERLGRFTTKGDARRAWATSPRGAVMVRDGEFLESRTGTVPTVERALVQAAERAYRKGDTGAVAAVVSAPAAPPAAAVRPTMPAPPAEEEDEPAEEEDEPEEEDEIEEEDDDDEVPAPGDAARAAVALAGGAEARPLLVALAPRAVVQDRTPPRVESAPVAAPVEPQAAPVEPVVAPVAPSPVEAPAPPLEALDVGALQSPSAPEAPAPEPSQPMATPSAPSRWFEGIATLRMTGPGVEATATGSVHVALQLELPWNEESECLRALAAEAGGVQALVDLVRPILAFAARGKGGAR